MFDEEPEYFTEETNDESKLIEHMLSEVEAHFEEKGRQNDFIESLREQFNERGKLSEKQVEALRKFYENV